LLLLLVGRAPDGEAKDVSKWETFIDAEKQRGVNLAS